MMTPIWQIITAMDFIGNREASANLANNIVYYRVVIRRLICLKLKKYHHYMSNTASFRSTSMISRAKCFAVVFVVLAFPLFSTADQTERETVRAGYFVDVEDVIPGIEVDIRYFGAFNFVGRRINGYLKPKCLLTQGAAMQLKKVQRLLNKQKFGLRIFDCYRPQTAVDDFVRWAKDLNDRKMKTVFYPNVSKDTLFERGYIAAKSSHSRGSTVDLTLVRMESIHQDLPDTIDESDGLLVDMGTPFDYFDPKSRTNNQGIPSHARRYRRILKQAMEQNGFKNLAEEWWHFTLIDEPFPDRYFSFPVD